mmetsp:Transcript_3741/g.8191  ORF Transcript_3741/g.8191 Transcript_3741/m.8191 type:complete len:406 (+) Transcript_3741:32-1249(+)
MNTTTDEPIPSKFQVWKLASRPHTLTASFVPVIVGYALTLQLIHRNSDLLLQEGSKFCAAVDAGTGDDGTDGNDAICYASDTQNNGATTQLLPLALRWALFAGLIQISTNLHNDYADFVKGADTDKRVGQARATQKGWLTPYETCRGCLLCLLAALFVGMYYLIPFHNHNTSCGREDSSNAIGMIGEHYDPIMIFTVLSSLFNAVAYTGGPFPLGYIGLGDLSIGYSGLGDLFVFLYFGIAATVGAPYLYVTKVAAPCLGQQQLRKLLYLSFLYSIPIGFLATAIIVVNNLRDRHTDIEAGKKTMAVRFGGTFAKTEYFVLVVGSYGFCIYFWILERGGSSAAKAWTSLLPLLSFPLAIPQLKAVAFGGKDGQALNEHVGGTAKLQMIYCILMAVGLVISSGSNE